MRTPSTERVTLVSSFKHGLGGARSRPWLARRKSFGPSGLEKALLGPMGGKEFFRPLRPLACARDTASLEVPYKPHQLG